MGEYSVANEEAQTSVVKKSLVHAGNIVDYAGNAHPVVRPPPLLSGERDACLHGAVDVCEIPGLDRTVSPPRASEHAEFLRDCLLNVDAYARTVMPCANRIDVGWLPGGDGEIDGVLEQARAPFIDEAGDLDLAGLSP